MNNLENLRKLKVIGALWACFLVGRPSGLLTPPIWQARALDGCACANNGVKMSGRSWYKELLTDPTRPIQYWLMSRVYLNCKCWRPVQKAVRRCNFFSSMRWGPKAKRRLNVPQMGSCHSHIVQAMEIQVEIWCWSFARCSQIVFTLRVF